MSRLRDAGLFVGLSLVWAATFPAIKVGLDALPPVLFAAARYDVAGLLLAAYVLLATDRRVPADRADWLAVAAGGAFLVAGNSLLFVGEQFTTSGVAAIVFSLVPLLTTAFAWVFLPGVRHTPLGLVGVLLGLVGVGIIAGPEPGNLLEPRLVGEGLVLLAASSVALGSVLVSRARPSIPVVSLTAWSVLLGAVILHAISAAAGEPLPLSLPPVALLAVGYLGVIGGAVAFVVYFDLLGRYGPLQISLISYAIPPVAAAMGWALLDEPITAGTVAGFLVIVAGFVLVERRALADELPGLRQAIRALW